MSRICSPKSHKQKTYKSWVTSWVEFILWLICVFINTKLIPLSKMVKGEAVQGNRSRLGAHSRALLTTARAAAPNATVNPMTAKRTNRRAAEGRATATTELATGLSRVACFCLRRRRRTESGRWVDASSKSLKVEVAMLWKKDDRHRKAGRKIVYVNKRIVTRWNKMWIMFVIRVIVHV